MPTSGLADFGLNREGEPGEYLKRLRREFPRFGIIADVRHGVWTALRGRHLTIEAADGIALRERLLEASKRTP